MRIRCGWYAWGRIRNSDSEDRRTARAAAEGFTTGRRPRSRPVTDAPAVAANRRLICPTLRPTTRIARSRRGRGHDDAHDFRLFLNAGGPPVVYRAAVSELVAILARPTDDGRQVVCAVWFGEDWAALVSGGARPRVGEVFWLGLFSTRHSRCRCAPRPSRRVARHQDLRGATEPGRGAPESVTTPAAVMGAATSAPAPSRPPRGTGCRAPRSCRARRCPPRSGPGRDARASRPSATARTARQGAPSTIAAGTRSDRQRARRPPASCLR